MTSTDSTLRAPAEAFPPHVFILEEMEARGWDVFDLALRTRRRDGRPYLPAALLSGYLTGAYEIDRTVSDRLDAAFGLGETNQGGMFLRLQKSYNGWRSLRGLPSRKEEALAAYEAERA